MPAHQVGLVEMTGQIDVDLVQAAGYSDHWQSRQQQKFV